MSRRDKRSCNSSRGRSSHLYNVALRVPLTTNRSEAGGNSNASARSVEKGGLLPSPLHKARARGHPERRRREGPAFPQVRRTLFEGGRTSRNEREARILAPAQPRHYLRDTPAIEAAHAAR